MALVLRAVLLQRRHVLTRLPLCSRHVAARNQQAWPASRLHAHSAGADLPGHRRPGGACVCADMLPPFVQGVPSGITSSAVCALTHMRVLTPLNPAHIHIHAHSR